MTRRSSIDNVVWVAPDQQWINKVLELLKDEFEMTVEGDGTAFLGIQFKHLSGEEIEMQQIGLIKRVLKATGLQDCNPDKTPASQKPLGTDKNGLSLQSSGATHQLWACCFILQPTLVPK